MKPLRICFLWHQHQPYYRSEEIFILPWVRFHSVKDYLDLALLLDEFPNIKQTFNIVPSLLLQIEEYLSNQVKDKIQVLSFKHPSELTKEEKNEILKQFFVCNYQNLIAPYPRYLQLYEKVKNGFELNEEELLDLQVWYNLAWVGPITRQRSYFQRFFQKGKNFTQTEKELLLNLHLKTLEEIVPTLKRLKVLQQIDLSISPFYHPILPLLIDNGIAKLGLPDIELGEEEFRYPGDALLHIQKGKSFFYSHFGFTPLGIWPSEGALSTEALQIILSEGFLWTATDPKLLFKTINIEKPEIQYFPFLYEENGKKLFVFFRDRGLSDAIGFTYHHWNTEKAVDDFINRLFYIRQQIINSFGEEHLEIACVPIILDGENCWEFYPENGLPFLKSLYSRLQELDEFKTTFFTDVVSQMPSDYSYVLKEIFPGSWIDANFYTWIGQKPKQKAWFWLSRTRKLVEKYKSNETKFNNAMELMLIAEGSDWFWWYGDDNIAPNKEDFDVLYRYYLRKIYECLEEEVPKELFQPLQIDFADFPFVPATQRISESNLKNLNTEFGWGRFKPSASIGTMHSEKELVNEIYFGNTSNLFLLGIVLSKELKLNDSIKVIFTNPSGLVFKINCEDFSLESTFSNRDLRKIFFSFKRNYVIGIDIEFLIGENIKFEESSIEFLIELETELGTIVYPSSGTLTYYLI
ncbi:MAG: glycoside hydrolase family 57 protein [Ignavibacteria bacterium]|nr:glycoside hydrolase family 57 protein [Ignavibacteria bacterium]